MSLSGRLDAFQRRHRAVGFPLAVIYKYTDDQGNYLAALITYYGFLGILPLLLLGSSILGFVLQGNPALQEQILNSTLSQFPVIGDQLQRPEGLRGSSLAVIIGVFGTLYGASGVAMALQNAMNVAWAVPRNKRGNPIVNRFRSLLLLATAGVGLLATTFVSTLGSDVDALNTDIGTGLKWGFVGASVAVNAGVFILLFRLATTHRHSLRRAVPGAITTAILWQLLQVGGTLFVSRIIDASNVASQVFGIVLGMIAYIFLSAICVVLGVEINVVKAHRLYPRALLTPFTDNVNLTPADQRAYADYAAAQRTKDFEIVDVSFEHHGQYLTAKQRAEQNGQQATPVDETPPKVTNATSGRPHDHH